MHFFSFLQSVFAFVVIKEKTFEMANNCLVRYKKDKIIWESVQKLAKAKHEI